MVSMVSVFSIFASPDQISAAERTDIATRLAPVLQLTPEAIQVKLATTRKFIYLARRVSASVAHQQVTLPNIIAIPGGQPIKVGNEVVGGIGVSGSPGVDDDCVNGGLEKVKDQLQ